MRLRAGRHCAALIARCAPQRDWPVHRRPSRPNPVVPALNWQPCDGDFRCATATVPPDYAHPRGATVQIAVVEHPATDPAHRIGSLFFNPGGPGGSGITSLTTLYPEFPATLRARFDLVSFDPRGIGQSTVLRCFDTIGQEQQLLAGLPAAYPVGRTQQRLWEATFARFDHACAAHAGGLLAHDTTADVARDDARLLTVRVTATPRWATTVVASTRPKAPTSSPARFPRLGRCQQD
jgi:pimeloyl-ACP methyl ester carboxylesterase